MNSLVEERRSHLRRNVIAIVVTMALVVGSAALAVTMSDSLRARMGITGKSVAPVAAGLKHKPKFKLSAKVLNGPLTPGVKHPLKVKIKNHSNKTLKVTSVTVKAGKPKGSPGCKPKWVHTTSFKATKKVKPIKIKPHSKAKVELRIKMSNLAQVNQDACKSAKIPLKLRAQAK